MSTQILIKRSTTTGAIPTTSDIAVGELAVNTTDKRIFTNNSGTIVELGTTPTTQTVTGNASVGGTFDVVGAVTVGNFTADGTVDLTSATVTIPAPTADTHPATKKYVDDEVNAILAGAPAALDTLNEIAAAINDDANVYTTLTNSIATKLSLSGGTMTGSIDMGANSVTTSVDPATANTLTRKSYVDGLYQSTVDAEVSAANALASEQAAATSASNASTSASASATSATASASSATNAASSATAAASSATSSANSATASATSATQSAASATQAQALVDSIESFYLGAEASAPTVDDNGDPLQAGDWYFNTTDSTTYIYNGSSWQSVSPDLVSDTTPQLGGNLDLNGYNITGTGNIDVTGTATMDGAYIQATPTIGNDSLTLGFTSPNGSIKVKNSSGSPAANLDLHTTDASGNTYLRQRTSYNGDISFYEDTGTTAKFFWDASAESLGIGTSSPAVALDVYPTVSSNTSALRGNNQLGSSGAYTTTVQSTNNWNYAPFVVERLASNTGTPRMISMQLDGDDPASTTIGGYNAIWGAYDSAPTTGSTSSALNGAMVYGAYSGHRWYNNGSERMRIDSSGNVGIGTSSPSYSLVVSNAGASGIEFQPAYSGTRNLLQNYDRSTSSYVDMTYSAATHRFDVSGSEKARIDSSGNLLVGTTSAASGFKLQVNGGAGNARYTNINTGGSTFDQFRFNGGLVGSITTNGVAVAYNTSSDYRLKEDAKPIANASDELMRLKPCNFAWKSTGERVNGFIAHELQEVIPEAATGTKDAMRTEEYEVSPAVYEDIVIPAEYDEEGNLIAEERTEQQLVTEAVMGTREVPDYQGIDQSKLVPLLTAALQEALTEIDNLKQRVSALETN